MATLRFRDRHLHKTIFEVVKAELTTKGWTGSSVPFGAGAVSFLDFQPDIEGEDIQPNLVSVSMGDPSVRTPVETGDGLFSYTVPFFIDIYGEKRSISESIGSDVMDFLRTYRDTSQIKDYTDPLSPVDSDDTWFVDNEQGPIQTTAAAEAQDFRKYWRVCRFLAVIEYLQ